MMTSYVMGQVLKPELPWERFQKLIQSCRSLGDLLTIRAALVKNRSKTRDGQMLMREVYIGQRMAQMFLEYLQKSVDAYCNDETHQFAIGLCWKYFTHETSARALGQLIIAQKDALQNPTWSLVYTMAGVLSEYYPDELSMFSVYLEGKEDPFAPKAV
jgi:hypothetical protein